MPLPIDLTQLLIASLVLSVCLILLRLIGKALLRFIKVWLITFTVLFVAAVGWYFYHGHTPV